MSNEMFTRNGRVKTDEALHKPMLANFEADKMTQEQSAAVARSWGMSTEMVQKLFPLAN